MDTRHDNRFQDFFEEGKYVVLKNYLYNYLLRKRAIERILDHETYSLILEVGSGISPVMTRTDRIVYSDLSFLACRTLKHLQGRGMYVVADATHLPFCEGAFSHTVSSEVLEHVEDDRGALSELARVLRASGCLIVTFPHRRAYFANDDRYVNHYRRYEWAEMAERLTTAGLEPIRTEKVLGLLEKLAMMPTVLCFEALQRLRRGDEIQKPPRWILFLAPLFKWSSRAYAALAWLEARVIPRRWATVLLIVARKKPFDNY